MNSSETLNPRTESLMQSGVAALAGVHAGQSLRDVLTGLMLSIEAQADIPMYASVLLLSPDGKHLNQGAAPSLPDAYNAAIDGVEIGPAVGSCGTAAYYGEPVFVDDIKTDPVWVDFRDLALEHGLRACWSTPIKDEEGKVLGTFANYYTAPRHPRPQDYQAIEMIAGFAARAIADYRSR